MFILLRRKKLKAIIHSLQNKNDTFVATEFNKFIKEKNDDGQDYIKGYGDGYACACKDILKWIEKK